MRRRSSTTCTRSASATATRRRISRRCPAARTATTSPIRRGSIRRSAPTSDYWAWIDALQRARHGPRAGPRAEPHGHREIGEPVVARRPRERAELALRALLRHRVAAGEGRARRQGPDSDPRRSVRRRARAAGAAARVSRRRASSSATTTRPLPIAPDTFVDDPRDAIWTRGWHDHRRRRRRRAAEHPDREPTTCRRAATRDAGGRSRCARAKRKS